jgi:hypothetical protein
MSDRERDPLYSASRPCAEVGCLVFDWQLPTPLPRASISESMTAWTAVICST